MIRLTESATTSSTLLLSKLLPVICLRKLQDRLAASTWPTLTLNHRNTYYVHGSNIVEAARNETIVCSVVLQLPSKAGRCDAMVMNPACRARRSMYLLRIAPSS